MKSSSTVSGSAFAGLARRGLARRGAAWRGLVWFGLGVLLALFASCTPAVNIPRRHALVYGVSRYVESLDTSSPPNLAYTVHDALAVAELLGSNGFEVTIRIDNEATRDQFLSDLEVFQHTVGPDDLFLFYYSGHGAQSDDASFFKGIELPGSDTPEEWIFFFGSVAYDQVTKRLSLEYSNTLNDDELGAALAGLPCTKRVAVIDACNSGGFIGNQLELDLAAPLYEGRARLFDPKVIQDTAALYLAHMQDRDQQADITPNVAIVISAAGEQELAFEDQSKKHGVFTHFFLMSAEYGDLNDDGFITTLEAFAFTRTMIDQWWNKFFRDLGAEYYTFAPHISGGAVDYVLFSSES